MNNSFAVAMNLTPKDIKNAQKLKEMCGLENKAQATSLALDLTAKMADALGRGDVEVRMPVRIFGIRIPFCWKTYQLTLA
jgi:hypothetical protein